MNWIVRLRAGQSGGLCCQNDEFIDRHEQLLLYRQELCCLTLYVRRHDATTIASLCSVLYETHLPSTNFQVTEKNHV